VPFRTKPALARAMIERALDAGVPAAWVTGDEVYGSDRRLRIALETRGQPFVLAIRSNEPLVHFGVRGTAQPRAAALAATRPPDAWQVLGAGAGTEGPRLYRWMWTDLARLGWPGWRHALLVREHRETGERAFDVVFAPRAATLADVVRVAGMRWRIEQAFEEAKQEVGLDECEVRKHDGWYRYMTLAMFAHGLPRRGPPSGGAAKGGSPTARSARPRSSRSPSPRFGTS